MITAKADTARKLGISTALIIEAIKGEKPVTVNQIEIKIGCTLTPQTIRKILKDLVAMGLVESKEISLEQIYKKYEYKLTTKGELA